MKYLIATTLFLIVTASSAFAQHNCPEGFRYVGSLSGTGGLENFNARRELLLPEGATLDKSYQQSSVRARGGNSRAKSDLRAAEIPRGIHIIPHGSTDLQKRVGRQRAETRTGSVPVQVWDETLVHDRERHPSSLDGWVRGGSGSLLQAHTRALGIPNSESLVKS